MKAYLVYFTVMGIRFLAAPTFAIIAISPAEAELAAYKKLGEYYHPRKVTVHRVVEDKERTKRLQFTLN